jgi:membrane-associated phospholipid phosphatase
MRVRPIRLRSDAASSISGLAVARAGVILVLFVLAIDASGQTIRYAPINPSDSVYQVNGRKLIIPTILAGYGFSQFAIKPIVDLNLRVRSEITSRFTQQFHIDNYSQYAPAAAVYGLNILGIRGKHDFIDRSVILATSLVIMEASVEGIKQLTHIQRPDGSAFNAFPSGHTATAFACAEFLYQEYKDRSVWYGIAGYSVAAATGFMRIYNNRHWLTDVVAGAGFGIFSTKMACWIFPGIKKHFFRNTPISISFVPYFAPRNEPVH